MEESVGRRVAEERLAAGIERATRLVEQLLSMARHENAAERAAPEPVDLADSSWGSGKDWRVWAGEQVQDLVELNADIVRLALDTVDKIDAGSRNRVADQLLREAILAVQSDWAFMVSKDSAAGYARDRAHLHAHAVREIAEAVGSGQLAKAERLAAGWSQADGLFGGLDARRLPRSHVSGVA